MITVSVHARRLPIGRSVIVPRGAQLVRASADGVTKSTPLSPRVSVWTPGDTAQLSGARVCHPLTLSAGVRAHTGSVVTPQSVSWGQAPYRVSSHHHNLSPGVRAHTGSIITPTICLLGSGSIQGQ